MERDPLERLRIWIEAEGFKGYDPYDALNSPLLSGLSLGNKYLRIAFIQTLKRLPVNLRPHLLVKKDYNPKGLGLFLWGYAKRYAREKEPQCLEQISKLLDLLDGRKTQTFPLSFRRSTALTGRLRNLSTPQCHFEERERREILRISHPDKSGFEKTERDKISPFGRNDMRDSRNDNGSDRAPQNDIRQSSRNERLRHGWGYNFDWQSRAFFVPKYTPTVVNSSFIGHALLDAFAFTNLTRAKDLAFPIGEFILRDLHRLNDDGTVCFSYTPIDHYFVHNANLLGASLLIRLYKETGNQEYKTTALAALAYSMKHQRPDGSWFYAENDIAHWIDSFHTGFNLQAIRYFLDLGFAEEYREQYEKGVRFYADHFFLADGTPKYYHDRVYPIDIHSPAQAIVFFSGLGRQYEELTNNILSWMIENMQGPSGAFYFQKQRHHTNKIPYMRWSQAWAFHALTEYLLHES